MDIFGILSSVAPTLYKAVTGDIGGAVGEALKAFGIETGTKDDLANAMKNATPEQIAALKKIDSDYKQRLAELDVDLEKIFGDDRKSARDMYIQTRDRLVPVLAAGIVICTFLLTGVLLFISVPDANKSIVDVSYGIVLGYMGSVVTFYFGSSKSSADKNAIMANMSKK